MAEKESDKIRFMLDKDKNEITFFLSEEMLRALAREAVKKKIDVDTISHNITDVCYLVAKELCKKLHIDMDKLKPNIIIEREDLTGAEER